MSYRINYYRMNRLRDRGWRIQLPVAAVLLLLSLLNGIYSFHGELTGLGERLMPWKQPEVQAACERMLDSIANGEPILDCVDAFCAEILDHEKETP